MTRIDEAAGIDRPPTEVLSFSVGEEDYCVSIQAVREIRGWIPATPLPHAPSYIRGVVNLRGTVLPIIDLGARLGRAATEATARHAIIVTEARGRVVGMLVDGVSGILTVTENAIHPTPDVGSDETSSFMKGLLIVGDRMISLLALDRVLPKTIEVD